MKAYHHIYYKKFSALKIALIEPKTDETGEYIKKAGCFMLEAAPVKGEKNYDWDNKIIFAVSAQEIANIEYNRLASANFNDFEDEGYALTHFPGQEKGRVKKLTIKPGKEGNGFFMNFYEKNGENTKSVSIILSNEEYFLFRELTLRTLPSLYGW